MWTRAGPHKQEYAPGEDAEFWTRGLSVGFTARKVATYRPTVPIVAATPEVETYRQLSLVWGVLPIQTAHSTDYDSLLSQARSQILTRGLARPGERVVVTAGVPFDVPGTTNLLKIEAL